MTNSNETNSQEEILEVSLNTHLKNSRLSSLVEDISQECGLISFESKTGIPIPLEKIKDSGETIETSGVTSASLQVLHEFINEPENALEYPFLLTGERGEDGKINIRDFDMLYDNTETLQGAVVQPNASLLGKSVENARKSGSDIYILGHTHPKLPQEMLTNVTSNTIPQTLKDKYGIKEVGLNVSLQDLYQLVASEPIFKKADPNLKRVYLAVLMWDGTMSAIEIKDGVFQRTQVNYQN